MLAEEFRRLRTCPTRTDTANPFLARSYKHDQGTQIARNLLTRPIVSYRLRLRRQRQVCFGQLDRRSRIGDLVMRRPQDAVDDHLAEGVDLEVAVEMTQRCCEGSATVGSLVDPTDDHGLVFGGDLQQWLGVVDRGVQVVFVVNLVLLPASADRMVGDQLRQM